jgi:hypothetical protein
MEFASLSSSSTLPGLPSLRELRLLDIPTVGALASRIRHSMVDSSSSTGGRPGPNLGVMELAGALRRGFDSPCDALSFDIGHATCGHGLPTAHGMAFAGLRQSGSPSGYVGHAQSEHHFMENSNAWTALVHVDMPTRTWPLSIRQGSVVGAPARVVAHPLGVRWQRWSVSCTAPSSPARRAHRGVPPQRKGPDLWARRLMRRGPAPDRGDRR